MANTKDITSANSNILLVGDSGTSKTRFMGSVPGIYVFDFDKGMASLRGSSIEYDTFKDLPRGVAETKPMREQGLYAFGTGWDAFFKKLQEIGLLIDKGTGPKAVGFDSLTFMSMLAVNKILKDTGQPAPHKGTWGAHHEYFKTVFGQVTAWPIRIIATAHIQRDENDMTKVIEKLPYLAGKLAGIIGAFFDEVYFTEVKEGTDKKMQYILKTVPSSVRTQAKSRWNVPDDTPTDFAALRPYFGETP